ncbi:hypothetical protein K2173_025563 [Erythroxylum novogranatense]|uniref:Dof-type domain-containing protein n=1 Tax=Erythroxylum novogranatense TaxID=1862640 RepID=A0AAV8TAI0_9ROSI|nr:hypothetical protein K2173_025563 [Erythroxylum novogranatense]
MNGADMPQFKDPAFKLFGRKIPVPDAQVPANAESKESNCIITKVETEGVNEDNTGDLDKSSASGQEKEENQNPIRLNEAQVTSKPKEGQVDTSSSDQDKVFKKPDKILPCPRCNSLDTKFCYFNNYNVNQPRHFCKNCQRYWTAGGTMRNVPIGAGRRKNKHLASQYHQILVSSDGMPMTGIETTDSANHQLASSLESGTALKPTAGNGMLLKFGPEAPLCESMETVLNLGDQKRYVEMSSVTLQDNGEELSSCGSSMTASTIHGFKLPENAIPKERLNVSNELSASHPMLCYSVPPVVFPWNPGWNNMTSTTPSQDSSGQVCMPNCYSSNPVKWCPTPILTVPGFCPPNIPLQFVPASYWGCMPVWASGTENRSASASSGCLSPSSSNNTSCCSGNVSPTLGKHFRDPGSVEEGKAQKCTLVPKALRIEHPQEASKSSSWATPGLKPDKDAMPQAIIFKTFGTKAEEKRHDSDATYILEANPAALSRSHSFQERS